MLPAEKKIAKGLSSLEFRIGVAHRDVGFAAAAVYPVTGSPRPTWPHELLLSWAPFLAAHSIISATVA